MVQVIMFGEVAVEGKLVLYPKENQRSAGNTNGEPEYV
jgi:hypothetical protein